jgi:two-component system chemotaxis sensor kinase CheA
MTQTNFAATFLQEADELLRQIETAALELEAQPRDMDLVNQLFRAFHTIKGSGAMFGFNAVVLFTHHVETTLDHVRESRVAVTPELVSMVLAAKDHIQALLTGSGSSSAEAGEQISSRFEALCQNVPSPAHAEPAARGEVEPAAEAPSGGAVERYRIFFQLEPSALGLGIDPGCILRELADLGPCIFHSGVEKPPPLAELGPDPSLRWELTLATDKPAAAIRDAFIFVEDLAQIRIDREAPADEVVPSPAPAAEFHAAEPHAPAPIEPVLAKKPHAQAPAQTRARAQSPEPVPASSKAEPVAASASAKGEAAPEGPRKRGAQQSTVRVPSERLDQLVNLVGELVINQSRLTQAFALGSQGEMAGAVESMDRMIADLRDSVLGIRMMPIGSTFSRFQRLVRDLGTELGKETEFLTEGAETELDKTVIDQLGDPLVHLIRNSLDHGIELPEERVQKGKPARGCLRLSAAHEGANVVITIRDDGRGLNGAALRAKAESKGLIKPDVHLTEQETFNLVFLPGLSTARAVTNISGRGVGLDVVKRTIDELRGSISLSSAPGAGTTTRLTLPLTLAIVDGLLVEIDADRFIIPMASVLENVELLRRERQAKNGRNLVNVRGELIPYVRLRELFDSESDGPDVEKVVIVAIHGKRLGLVVDHVLGSHQTVIQSLGRFYRSVELFSGTTIMGDGRVAIILDLAGVVRHVERQSAGRGLAATSQEAAPPLPRRTAPLEQAL